LLRKTTIFSEEFSPIFFQTEYVSEKVLASSFHPHKVYRLEGLEMGRISFLAGVTAFAMVALFLSCFDFFAHGQSEIGFSPTNRFVIPANNSSISFAVDGTYEQAYLENGMWSFVNLRFDNSQSAEKLSLKVSAEESNVTITSCLIYNSTFAEGLTKAARLRYEVVGQGKQVFDLGLDPKRGDWNVIVNGVYIGKNHGWTLFPDGTLTVAEATGNVTLSYYGFPGSFGDSTNGFSEQFLNKHSAIIFTAIVFVAIVLFALAFKAKKKG
jgi:hypothetical protein